MIVENLLLLIRLLIQHTNNKYPIRQLVPNSREGKHKCWTHKPRVSVPSLFYIQRNDTGIILFNRTLPKRINSCWQQAHIRPIPTLFDYVAHFAHTILNKSPRIRGVWSAGQHFKIIFNNTEKTIKVPFHSIDEVIYNGQPQSINIIEYLRMHIKHLLPCVSSQTK